MIELGSILQRPAHRPARAGIVGAGITGLAAGLRLAERGCEVTVFEASDHLGGLGDAVSLALDGEGGSREKALEIERFYHCLLPSDAALLQLVTDVGLENSVAWRETRMGFMVEGALYPLNTPRDLLRFSPLRLDERLRLAALALWARFRGTSPSLDGVTAESWLRRLAGERAYRTVWEPLLRAKLGDAARTVPALWVTSRLHREKNTGPERKGFLRGGYRSLTEAIEKRLRELGGTIEFRSPAKGFALRDDSVSIRFDHRSEASFDFAVCTAPLPLFQKLAAGLSIAPSFRGQDLDYQGVICGVLVLDRPLSNNYWTPFVDSGATAQGVVEMSNLLPLERTRGNHVSYFVNYCHRDSEFYRRSDASLLDAYRRDLSRLYPRVEPKVKAARLFRAPFVEPIWRRGALANRPPFEAIPGRLYSLSTTQLYPRVNSWNSCCELVEEWVASLPAAAEATG